MFFFFFFQAEDGIRDHCVTGVQTCALPICRGLSRPDPQDIAQSVTFTTNSSPGSQKNTATLGNPGLKAETADNFDVLVERYLNPFGMISAGYFYKRLTDPI